MSETTLRLKTQAELAALRRYHQELDTARGRLVAFTAAVNAYNKVRAESPGASPGAPVGVPGASAPTGGGYPFPGAGVTPGGASGPGGDVSPGGGVSPGRSRQPIQEAPGNRARLWQWRARNFVSNASSTAVGVGLGGSVAGFFLGSGQKYMELSRIITHLGRRFRETAGDAAHFGTRLGFTLAETGPLIESLGEQTDRVTREQAQRYLGFARERGLDPGVAMSALGGLERVLGHGVTDDDLATMLTRASRAGMGQGRFAEYVRAQTELADQAHRATGHVSLGQTRAAMSVSEHVFGAGSAHAQGMAGVDFAQRLGSVVSGRTNPAMQTFMMRAMGYGAEGGPGYIEMRKRMEAGVFDSQNVTDMFDAFRDRGMGRGAMFRGLESVAGGQLKAFEIESLINSLGTQEGLQRFRDAQGGSADDRAAFLSTLSGDDRRVFEQMGFAGLGQRPGRIGMGEYAGVQMEQMQMSVGGPVAQGMLDLRETLINVASTLDQLTGMDIGESLTDLTGAIRSATESIDTALPAALDGLSIASELGLGRVVELLLLRGGASDESHRALREARGHVAGGGR